MNLNIIYNEDCFETFKKIDDKSIDMILCDLPYGMTACKWDTRIPLEPLWKEYKRIIKKNGAIVLTASQPFTSILVMSNLEWFKHEWIWNKGFGVGFQLAKYRPLQQHENILVFCKTTPKYNPQMKEGIPYKDRGDRPIKTDRGYGIKKRTPVVNEGTRFPLSVIEYNSQLAECNNTNRIHPSQKPVALFEYLIKTYTNQGDLVLDNCIGSGTTAIACINTKRNYIGSEINKEYYDIAIKRIRDTRY